MDSGDGLSGTIRRDRHCEKPTGRAYARPMEPTGNTLGLPQRGQITPFGQRRATKYTLQASWTWGMPGAQKHTS